MNYQLDLENLECSVCMNCLYLPVTLVCKHSFCLQCLLGLIINDRLSCPSCRGQLKILNSPVLCPECKDHPFEILCPKFFLSHKIKQCVINQSLCKQAAKLFRGEMIRRRNEILFTDVQKHVNNIDLVFLEVNSFFREYRRKMQQPQLRSKTEQAIDIRSSQSICDINMLFISETENELREECNADVIVMSENLNACDEYLLKWVQKLIQYERELVVWQASRPGEAEIISNSVRVQIRAIRCQLNFFIKKFFNITTNMRVRRLGISVRPLKLTTVITPPVKVTIQSRRLGQTATPLLLPNQMEMNRAIIPTAAKVNTTYFYNTSATPDRSVIGSNPSSSNIPQSNVIPSCPPAPTTYPTTYYFNTSTIVQGTNPPLEVNNATPLLEAILPIVRELIRIVNENTCIIVDIGGVMPLVKEIVSIIKLAKRTNCTSLIEEECRPLVLEIRRMIQITRAATLVIEPDATTLAQVMTRMLNEMKLLIQERTVVTQVVSPQLNEMPTPNSPTNATQLPDTEQHEQTEQPQTSTGNRLSAFFDRIRRMF